MTLVDERKHGPLMTRRGFLAAAGAAGAAAFLLANAPQVAAAINNSNLNLVWLRVDSEGRISNYQVVAPTTWNASPKCSELKNGPLELALLGGQTTPSGYLPGSEANPVGLYHTIRSFDPCVACAVHFIGR